MNKVTPLVDADVLIYRAAAAAQTRVYLVLKKESRVLVGTFQKAKEADAFISGNEDLVREFHIVPEPLNNAIHNVNAAIHSAGRHGAYAHNWGAPELFVSGESNFRKSLATIQPYKGNRKESSRPAHYYDLRDYVLSKYKTTSPPMIEADDAISIRATQLRAKGAPYVVCSVDKDLDQIPGMHFNVVTKEHYEIGADYAMRWFYTQLLTGDATDNIKGCHGIGPRTAEKLLGGANDEADMLAVCEEQYKKSYGEAWMAAVVENGRLLRLLDAPPLDNLSNLWNPYRRN